MRGWRERSDKNIYLFRTTSKSRYDFALHAQREGRFGTTVGTDNHGSGFCGGHFGRLWVGYLVLLVWGWEKERWV
jgi:hypothetical protein